MYPIPTTNAVVGVEGGKSVEREEDGREVLPSRVFSIGLWERCSSRELSVGTPLFWTAHTSHETAPAYLLFHTFIHPYWKWASHGRGLTSSVYTGEAGPSEWGQQRLHFSPTSLTNFSQSHLPPTLSFVNAMPTHEGLVPGPWVASVHETSTLWALEQDGSVLEEGWGCQCSRKAERRCSGWVSTLFVFHHHGDFQLRQSRTSMKWGQKC